ncbi:hypothetical protein DFAR_3850029 [Desulfarculales bacterium]
MDTIYKIYKNYLNYFLQKIKITIFLLFLKIQIMIHDYSFLI